MSAATIACSTSPAAPATRRSRLPSGAPRSSGLDLTPTLLEEGRRRRRRGRRRRSNGSRATPSSSRSRTRASTSCSRCSARCSRRDHAGGREEIARVLRSGGRMAVCNWTPDGNIGQVLRDDRQPHAAAAGGLPAAGAVGDRGPRPRACSRAAGSSSPFEPAQVDWRFDSPEAAIEQLEHEARRRWSLAKAALEPEGKWEALRRRHPRPDGARSTTSDHGEPALRGPSTW